MTLIPISAYPKLSYFPPFPCKECKFIAGIVYGNMINTETTIQILFIYIYQ